MSDLLGLLADVPTRTLKGTFVRAVASRWLYRAGKAAAADFLFASGRPNRFNLEGTECIYLAQDEPTALAEYRRQFKGLAHGAKQPVTLFHAEVRLAHVLDLSDQATRRALSLTLEELETDWGAGLPETPAQALGEAVARQGRICAIRYRSVAAAKASGEGHNLVVFKACVHSPDFVHIVGPTRRALQKWP